MSNFNQALQIVQGTDETITVQITAGAYTSADVASASFLMRRRGTTAVTKTLAGAGITARHDATYIYLDILLVGVDTASISGVYEFEVASDIGGTDKRRAAGHITVLEAGLS